MDQYIKQSIGSRRQAIFNTYEVDPEKQKKIDTLFKEIEKLGAKCKDVGEFETEFAKSPLNQQYLDLFTEIATDQNNLGGKIAKGTATGAIESVTNEALKTVVPTTAAVNQKVTDAARDVPILGDAIDLSQKASYATHLGRLFKRKK